MIVNGTDANGGADIEELVWVDGVEVLKCQIKPLFLVTSMLT
jgi:hypothetical protein